MLSHRAIEHFAHFLFLLFVSPRMQEKTFFTASERFRSNYKSYLWIMLFADDSALYRHIESSADHDKLQQDLLQLEEWEICAYVAMNFAPSKCYIMSITFKRQPSSFSYTLCNTPLEGVMFQKYIGSTSSAPSIGQSWLWRWKRIRIKS